MNRSIKIKKQQAIEILSAVGIPVSTFSARKQDRLALTLLALANLKPRTLWNEASFLGDGSEFGLTTKKIIEFWNANYGENMSKGSYDDVKRKELAILLPASIAVGAMDPDANINNPTRSYTISDIFSPVLLEYKTEAWHKAVKNFLDLVGSFADRLERKRDQAKVSIRLQTGVAQKVGGTVRLPWHTKTKISELNSLPAYTPVVATPTMLPPSAYDSGPV